MHKAGRNTFRGHILRSIHHHSLLSVLAYIQNTFCKKVQEYTFLLLWDSFYAFCVCYYDGDHHHDHQCATVTLTILLCMGLLLRLGSQSGICECSILVLFHASFSGSARQIGRRKLCQSGLTSSHFHIKVLKRFICF